MKERLFWFDNVRVIATIAVIILHVSAPILYRYGEINNEFWTIGNFYDGMVRFSVPIFFMLSGALLLNKDYELSDFFKKRFWRIIPPLIFWSLIYIFYDYVLFGERSFTPISFAKLIVRKIFYGSKFHLWFVYTLLGLYLIIPILRKWIKNSNNKEISYFIAIWFATIIYGIPYFKTYLPQIPLIHFSGYIGYLVLGYYLSNLKIRSKYIPILFIIIGTGVTIYGTFYVTHKKSAFFDYFYEYLSPNVLLSAVGVFLLLKNYTAKNKKSKTLISFLSDQSFGIYLAHILILSLLDKIGINWEFGNPIISIPITSIICLVLSSLTIYLLRKIKYGSYISG